MSQGILSEDEIADARKHLGVYYILVNPGYRYVRYQQEKIAPALEALEAGTIRKLAIFMSPGDAKLCAHDTLVPTPTGWKEHGDLRAGDFVFGVDGQQVQVIAEHPQNRADVRVTMSDGSEFFVHENHEWTVYDRTTNRYGTVETKHFLRQTKFGKARVLRSGKSWIYYLPRIGPLDYDDVDLSLHPYVLGAWLGDGTSSAPHITYGAKDAAVVARIEACGYVKSGTWVHKTTGVLTSSFAGSARHAGPLTSQLQTLGLIKQKHIPEIYKRSSIQQRLELLAGLIDTDGSKDLYRGRYCFVNCNKRLIDDVVDVVESLGWRTSVHAGKLYRYPDDPIISKQTPYYLTFNPSFSIPVALPRKVLTDTAVQRRYVAIAEVERVGGPRKGKCITVSDPRGLYLVGENLVPTHNSDWATRAFAPWYMGKHPERNVMVCSYSAELASDDFGTRIKERIKSPTHLAIFPESRLTKDSHGKTHFRTIKGGDFYSNGYSGSIGGKRLDCFIGDDLIKNWDEAQSELVQNSLFETYKGVIKDRMRPGGIMVLCAHRWTSRDVYYRILEHDGTVEQGGDWTVITLPAEDPIDSGKFLWEEHHGKKHYLDFKLKDERTWWSKFQQNPSRSESFWFRKEWLNFYDNAIPWDRYNNYMFIDPAGTKSKQSDYTSLIVWAAGQEGKLFIADWVFDKFDPGERVQMIMNKVRKWKPAQVIYEEYGLNNDTYYITEKMREAKINERFYPIAVGKKGPRHSLSKNERIRGIIPFFREGKLFLPRKMMYRQHNGQEVDLTQRFINEEYSIFRGEGTTVHDDDLDNMSRLLEDEVHIQYYEPPAQEEDEEWYQGESKSSWESRY